MIDLPGRVFFPLLPACLPARSEPVCSTAVVLASRWLLEVRRVAVPEGRRKLRATKWGLAPPFACTASSAANVSSRLLLSHLSGFLPKASSRYESGVEGATEQRLRLWATLSVHTTSGTRTLPSQSFAANNWNENRSTLLRVKASCEGIRYCYL